MTRASVRGRRGVMACATLLCAWRALGADGDMAEVRLPLERYDALVHGSRPDEPVLPAAYALGAARVTVNVSDPPRAIADAELSIRVPRDGWVAVPVLPAGTAVSSVTVGGAPAQLAALPLGLCWIAEKAGSYEMAISYRADASRSESGYGLGLPVPAASAITIDARLPGVDIDVSVIPSAGVTIAAAGGATTVSATVPTTTGVQIAWHAPGRTRPAIGRASYRGEIKGEAAAFTASLDVDCFTSESTTLPVLPGSATLRNIAVDGHDAPIVSEGANHATLIRGLGHHTVVVELEVPIVRGDGPARVEMDVLPIPVSRFEVRMAGKKDLQVVPAADVAQRLEGGATVATMFVPQTSHVTLRWAEAVPEEIKAEVQWSASITHVVSASEGLLQVHAYLAYEVTRGESNVVSLDVPREVEVNRISSPSGAVVDWRDAAPPGQPRRIDVFLDRKVRGELPIEVLYDRPLVEGAPTALPLLRAIGPQRQHGIVVLLAGREVSLSPGDVGAAVRVGENQIPGSLRETLGSPVTHTLKYPGDPPGMTVVAAPPEKKPARFDASVETLVSVGEAALRGCAIVQLDVKSSAIGELSLALPPDVTLLGLSGPSIREHTVVASEGAQQIAVMFTEEMEGRCRIELSWERLFPGDRASVPLVTVGGADVEQGRVAVESLSAAEVKAAAASNVTAIDVGELPRELVLRTANPILLAYRYAHARSAPEITLEVTRHRVVGVLEAVIEEAAYRTLVTRDGLLVTTADFVVKNSRQQFLRVALPAGSTVWSALVDGRREKPATGAGSSDAILVKIVSSTRGFPVRIVYQTKGPRIGRLGTVRATLARPEGILVTRTRWDVYLPDGFTYGDPRSNMDLAMQMPRSGLHERPRERGERGTALAIDVPASGKHFAFEKLYANQGDGDAWLSIGYASQGGARAGQAVVLFATLLGWAGALTLRAAAARRAGLIAMAAALVTIVVAVSVYDVSVLPAVAMSIAAVGAIAAVAVLRRVQRRSS